MCGLRNNYDLTTELLGLVWNINCIKWHANSQNVVQQYCCSTTWFDV